MNKRILEGPTRARVALLTGNRVSCCPLADSNVSLGGDESE